MVRIKKKIMVAQDETHKFCDVCEIEIPLGLACNAAHCAVCGADLCEKCIGHEDESYDDYRITWCKSCWDIGIPYREKMDKLREECDAVAAEWHQLAKEAASKRVKTRQIGLEI